MEKDKKSGTLLWYVIVPSFLILVAAVILNVLIYGLETRFFSTIYSNEVAETKALISRRFQSAKTAAEITNAFFVSSQEVTKDEFDSFASVLFKEKLSSGVITVPVTIEWIDKNNQIQYVYPMNADNAKIIGLDLNKYPNRLLPITKAKETGETVITEPIMLAQGYPGLILYSPIFKGDSYLGESVVVVRLANLFAPTIGNTPVYQKDIYLQTGNFIAPFDDDMILNENGERIVDSQGNLVKEPQISAEYPAINKTAVSADIVFADKTWQLKFNPTYTGQIYTRMAGYVGFSLFFTLSSTIFLLILHRRRQQILKEKAKTEALIVSVGDGIVACDKNWKITFVNKESKELLGYSEKEMVGISAYDILHLSDSAGSDTQSKEKIFYSALTNKEIVSISTLDHFYLLKKSGERFPTAFTIAPILINGKVDGAIVVFRDITKDSEVDRMKTEFLSLATHQLLTPASAITWISETLLRGAYGPLNEKQEGGVKDIHTSSERMGSLITALLDISRIESGRLMVAPKPTHVEDLARDILKELSPKIEKKGHSIKTDFEGGLPEINIDPALISEIYKNLLTNAIKYTPGKGEISVTIKKKGDDIVSEVKDNGYGIPADEKKKMFEKFYRGGNIISVEKDGNGLGLYLVKQIVDVSGGKIGFESEVGKGTTFWFSMPISGSKPKAGEVSITTL